MIVGVPLYFVGTNGFRMCVGEACGVLVMRVTVVRVVERRPNECPEQACYDTDVKECPQSSSILSTPRKWLTRPAVVGPIEATDCAVVCTGYTHHDEAPDDEPPRKNARFSLF